MSGMNDKYPLALPVGTVLAGQYIIEKILGQGGFGITYEAVDHKTNEKVAVKEFFPDTLATRTQSTVTAFSGERGDSFTYGKTCFLQEAETLAKFIGNENIVRIHSYFEENGTAYFVMDFVEGMSFDQYIKAKGGKIPYEDAKNVLIPIMDALYAVHNKGIVHRDVTPDNIFITNAGVVKLLDFGAARYSLGDKSRSLDVVLKHGFAPKEQYTRRGKQGPFTDVYSLGASFYFALTGKRPPDSVERLDEDDLIPPSSLGVQIPKSAEDAILKAMSVQTHDRFQTMLAFKQALLSNAPVSANAAPAAGALGNSAVQQRFFSAPVENASNTPNTAYMPGQAPMHTIANPAVSQNAAQPMMQQTVMQQPVQRTTMQQPAVQQTVMQPQNNTFTSAAPAQGSNKKWILPVVIGGSTLMVGIIVMIIVLAVNANKQSKTPYTPDPEPVVNTEPSEKESNVPVTPTPVAGSDEPSDPIPAGPTTSIYGTIQTYSYFDFVYGMTKDEIETWLKNNTNYTNAQVNKYESGDYDSWDIFYTEEQCGVEFSGNSIYWDSLIIDFDIDEKVDEFTFRRSGDWYDAYDQVAANMTAAVGEPSYSDVYEGDYFKYKYVCWNNYDATHEFFMMCSYGTDDSYVTVSFKKY
ncbi:MAG: protein kinase [Lachnospiraceae bacterium]|nr:protein kinase [Lachnospiraceae bacterium]